VTTLIQRLAKHEPDALELLDDIYPVKFAPPDPGTKNSGDVHSGGIGFDLSGDDDGEEA
jgi:hypothetical protein